jgi:hypothetical protein
MIVKKILTTSICGLSDRPGERPLWLLGPVESRPDRPAGLVAVDAPLIGDGANDVQSMVPGRIDHPLVPGAAVVLDCYPNVMVLADCGPDSEGATGQAERLCWAALAASSEAHRITSSARGQSSRIARRPARTARMCSVPAG